MEHVACHLGNSRPLRNAIQSICARSLYFFFRRLCVQCIAPWDFGNSVTMSFRNLHDLPNQISMAREELQAKQNELQSKKLDLEKLNQKLAKQKALVTKTELLSKEMNDRTGTGQEKATLLDANKNFDQTLELLKKDLHQISAKLNKQNESITFASNQCKLAEEHLSLSLSLRNKFPAIFMD